ncbi:MAG: SHOCT domain-containing protein [Thaumarchaeota archaeon]|nr:SHOCT domain-containing protein [Nitrososphaerota archaeon]
MKSGFTLAWIPILIVVAVLATDIGLALYLRSYSPSSLGFWFPFPFFPLLFIPVVFLFFFGMRWFFWGGWGWNRGWYGPYHDSVLETLRQRFALGEITQEQFDDMAKALRGKEEGGECTP